MAPVISQLVITIATIMALGLPLMVSCQQSEVNPTSANETSANAVEGSTRPPLTGIPQIDYIWDPNLPHELNGFNLSSYPFYPSIPPRDKMDFECDGLHDGFYASVLHKCQVYHQCLFGQRYDFLCANFTAFDQKNFICHFANEVDCDNSPKFFDRNEALYKAASTTPEPTPPTVVVRTRFVGPDGRPARRPGMARFQRPNANRRPVYYDDYYDYEYFYDEPGNEDEEAVVSKNTGSSADNAVKPDGLTEEGKTTTVKQSKAGAPRERLNGGQGNRQNIFNNNRPPPRIRPPVPNSDQARKPTKQAKTTTTTTISPEDEFYDYVDYAEGEEPLEGSTTTTTTTTTTPAPTRRRSRRPKTTTTTTLAPVIEEEFFDEEFEEEIVEPLTTTQRPTRPRVSGTRRTSTTTATTTTTTTTEAPVVTDEPVDQLSNSPSTTQFNRRASVNNLLRRRIPTSSPTEDNTANEEVLSDEPVSEDTAQASATTTTSGPTRRTTRARPTRPANTPRQRSTTIPAEIEEEAPTTVAQVAESIEPAVEVEAPVRRGRPRRPVAPVAEEDVAPVSTRRDSRDSQLATEVEEEEEIFVSQNNRQERQLNPDTLKTVVEESADFDDEDLGESQWSIINLFSRVFPQRA